MNDKTQAMLQQLADKLGVTVTYLWSVLVRGNKTEGFILLTFVLLGMGMVAVGVKMLRYAWKNDEEEHGEAYVYGGLISCGVGIAMFVSCFYWCVMDLFTPEYGALTDILSHLK